MATQEQACHRMHEAADQFNRRLARTDGPRVVASLTDGLNGLAEALLVRVQSDAERVWGADSMLLPTSLLKTQQRARLEIDIDQCCESAEAAQAAGIADHDRWYADWVLRLRLGEAAGETGVVRRVAEYAARDAAGRRLLFMGVLERLLPGARRAPLVLYRLYPLAVRTATALALGHGALALESRRQQLALLPAIADCHQCRGALLDNGESCPQCGNPLWKYEWLTSL